MEAAGASFWRGSFLASRHPTNRLAALRGNPALTSDQNALRAWVHKNFGAFAPCKRFAQQNLGGGRIHFARAFQFPERNPKKEVTTYVVTSFFGAGDEARTRYLHLGKVALYQMSYIRKSESRYYGFPVVPSVGIEPTTRGFSVLCSTN